MLNVERICNVEGMTHLQVTHLTERGHVEKSTTAVSRYIRRTLKTLIDNDVLVTFSWTGSSKVNRFKAVERKGSFKHQSYIIKAIRGLFKETTSVGDMYSFYLQNFSSCSCSFCQFWRKGNCGSSKYRSKAETTSAKHYERAVQPKRKAGRHSATFVEIQFNSFSHISNQNREWHGGRRLQ